MEDIGAADTRADVAQPPLEGEPLLRVENLKTHFFDRGRTARAVDGIGFALRRGQTLGLVGESGCGKSVAALSIMRLVPDPPGKIVSGEAWFEGRDLLRLSEAEMRRIRGNRLSMIFQEPMTALSPVHTVGDQICEAILLHQQVSPEDAERRAVEMLRKVGIPNAEGRARQYPFEMSGGMRQRVVIAMALACNPEALIADEPTTALDVTIQAQILGLMRELQRDLGTSILLITHDLGVVAQMADDVAVMYLGRVVERADVRSILKRPRHPYTMGLLASLPSLSRKGKDLPSIAGSVPSLTRIPRGCPFHPRCPFAQRGLCDSGDPPELRRLFDEDRDVACVRAEDIAQSARAGFSH